VTAQTWKSHRLSAREAKALNFLSGKSIKAPGVVGKEEVVRASIRREQLGL
jgi:hypothetical protein